MQPVIYSVYLEKLFSCNFQCQPQCEEQKYLTLLLFPHYQGPPRCCFPIDLWRLYWTSNSATISLTNATMIWLLATFSFLEKIPIYIEKYLAGFFFSLFDWDSSPYYFYSITMPAEVTLCSFDWQISIMLATVFKEWWFFFFFCRAHLQVNCILQRTYTLEVSCT